MNSDLLVRTIERVDACEDTASLWRTSCDVADALGFVGVAYEFTRFGVLMSREKAERHEEGFEGCRDGLCPGDLDALRDVVFRRAFIDTRPFLWTELATLPWLDGMKRTVEEAVARCGTQVLTFPANGPHIRHGYFAFVLAEGAPDRRDEWRLLQLVTHAIHLRWSEIDGATGPTSASLTPRERSVVQWLARGKSNAEIATILGISSSTIDTHVRRIYAKLGVHDRVNAAVIASATGLLHDPHVSA